MRYATFGRTGLNLSKIAVGTWGIGGVGWGGQDEGDAIAAIHAMLDKGVNFIDTAPVYGFGAAEVLVGEAIAGRDRSQITIADKFGVTWPGGEGTGLVQNGSRENIMREIDLALSRIGTDYIDLYMQHWPDTDTKAPASETFGTLQELKEQGVIRHVGVSNSSVELIGAANEFTDIEFLQVQHSMLERGNEELMAWAKEHEIAVMAWAPLAAGMLTGKYRSQPSFAPDDWRTIFYPFFTEPAFTKAQEVLRVLDGIAAAHDAPVSAVAINWSAQHPLVSAALLGVRNQQQGEENAAALDWELAPEEFAASNAALEISS
ncbi:MAG: aldo/keto reductase [Propionibacteriaceae bacterium]|jgi:aryl-alcohol dehydrogenase-like predicted oxidoreductase|nr:aldo/keto reductase [Propionibacteriaceae bacterium]